MSRPRLSAVLVALALAGPAAAQTTSLWNLPAGGSWGLAGNWSAGLPGVADTVAFNPNVVAAEPLALALDGSRTVNAVSTREATAAVTISAGTDPIATLTLSGAAGSSGLFAEAADLTVGVTFRSVGASVSLFTSPGRTLEVYGLWAEAPAGVGNQAISFQDAGGAGAVRLGAGGLDITGGPASVSLTGSGGSALTLAASQRWALSGSQVLSVTGGGVVNLGAAGTVLTLAPVNLGAALAQVVVDGRLTGAGGLTLAATLVTAGGTSTGPGAGFADLRGNSGANTATGPLRVDGGTLAVGPAGWGGTSVPVTAGQLIPYGVTTPSFPAATTLTLSDTGAYNVAGLNSDGSLIVGTYRHFQTYQSVGVTGSGNFNTGTGALTVSGTFTHAGSGDTTVNASTSSGNFGSLTVNRLDLRPPATGTAGGFFVRGIPNGPPPAGPAGRG